MFISKNKLEEKLDAAWHDGFEIGRKKVVPEIKKVYIKLLTEEINDEANKKQPGAWLKGLDRATEIIRRGRR
jgi:hypothetical protein